MLAALILGQLVAIAETYLLVHVVDIANPARGMFEVSWIDLHVVGQLLEVVLLLAELLAQLKELLLLALADREILVGLFALLEGITVLGFFVSLVLYYFI